MALTINHNVVKYQFHEAKMELQKTAQKEMGNVSSLVKKYRGASKAEETKRAIKKNWVRFEIWARENGGSAFPVSAELLESYLVALATEGLSVATVDQAKWAVDAIHRAQGYPPPGDTERVRTILSGIRRQHGRRQKQKEAITFDHVGQMQFPKSLAGIRDKALLLVGIAGGFRRSELAAIDVADIKYSDKGMYITVRRSKTDQEGRGAEVFIARGKSKKVCPLAALEDWLDTADIDHGPIFRSVNKWHRVGTGLSTVSIWRIVRSAAASLGLDPKGFGGHSLRAGCATYLLEKGVPMNIVAKHGRWKKLDTVMRYDRNTTEEALYGIY